MRYRFIFLTLLLALAGCQTPEGPKLDRALAALRNNPSDARAQAAYRKAATAMLPDLLESPVPPKPGYLTPAQLSDVETIRHSRATVSGLHRAGCGLPIVGVISREKSGDPNTPRAGFKLPLTALVLPAKDKYELRLAEPEKIKEVTVEGEKLPVAMNLEAPIDAAQAAGPRFGDGIRYLLRSDWFSAPAQLAFLAPYDARKTPIVFVHGLMSTPRMWVPVIKQLTAVKEIRDRYQFWFFYYPTGQPVPLSALQFREALDAAVQRHRVTKPLVLVGHSMGGILSRAQVSKITQAEAVAAVPWLARVPSSSTAHRAMIFEARPDVGRVVFMNTPHRGSRLALTGIAGIGMQLIRLPSNITNELEEFAKFIVPGGRGRMPTSIQGLSPRSPFLQALDRRPPSVPHHTVLGDRGRGDSPNSSDGVVPYASAHLASAQSEVIAPGGHGSFSDPKAIRELERILLEYR